VTVLAGTKTLSISLVDLNHMGLRNENSMCDLCSAACSLSFRNSAFLHTDFPRAFYEKLLGFEDYGAHQTVKDSLDHASQVIWGTSWWYTPFSPNVGYDIYVEDATPPLQEDVHMQVLGNSGLTMPYG